MGQWGKMCGGKWQEFSIFHYWTENSSIQSFYSCQTAKTVCNGELDHHFAIVDFIFHVFPYLSTICKIFIIKEKANINRKLISSIV